MLLDGWGRFQRLVSPSGKILPLSLFNPYSAASNSWDYGFFIRDSGSGATNRFIEIVVTSRGRWSAAWREGVSTEDKEISSGTLNAFDTSVGGQNRLWLAVIGDRGLLFVNGEFVSFLDVSVISGPGDVAVITGAFTGDEVAGAITRFEEFTVVPVSKGYGPATGSLVKEPGFVAEHRSGLWVRDLIVEAEFAGPTGNSRDYGFIIRNPESGRLEVIGITGEGRWFHETSDKQDRDYTTVSDGFILGTGATLQARNHLLMLAIDDIGLFFINGQLVARLDLSHNQDYGGVSVMGDFFLDHQGSPSFSNFNVWTPQP